MYIKCQAYLEMSIFILQTLCMQTLKAFLWNSKFKVARLEQRTYITLIFFFFIPKLFENRLQISFPFTAYTFQDIFPKKNNVFLTIEQLLNPKIWYSSIKQLCTYFFKYYYYIYATVLYKMWSDFCIAFSCHANLVPLNCILFLIFSDVDISKLINIILQNDPQFGFLWCPPPPVLL